jgi:diguanylate cyclase (GGDEF)-like protein
VINKILLVDDIQDNLDLLEDLLDDEFNYGNYSYKVEFMQANNGQTALDLMKENDDIDLVLLDVMMPHMDGFEVCKILKEDELTQHTPIIFLSAKSESTDVIRGFDLGASDYVSKPFQEEELIARVRKELKIKMLIKKLEYIASYDTMTGIYNRRKFFELATRRLKQDVKNLYVVMIDIDKFKNINDSYGIAVGDKVIKHTTAEISKLIRKDSIFGRLGGEEFALVCYLESYDLMVEKTQKIRKVIEKLKVTTNNNEEINFTISLGVKKVDESMKNIDALLNEADIALYEAKETGRNKVIFRVRKKDGI